MSILHLTTKGFDEKTKDGLVLVDFWAEWCMPCRMLAPIIEELAAERSGSLTVAKVDVESESALAARFEILNIPTVILFRDGVEVRRFIGAQSKETYAAALE